MPIVLPNLGSVSPTDPMPMVSGHDAAAPWVALGAVADSIAQAGKVAGGIGLDIQNAENDADVNATLRQLSERRAAFEQSLLDDHDYRNYGTRLESEILTPARDLITPEMAPVVRQELDRRIADWESQLRIDTNRAAQRKAVERATGELRLARDTFIENGDEEAYNERVDASSFLTPEEKALEKREAAGMARDRRAEMDIQRDPAGWLEANPEPPESPGEYVRWNQRRDLARSELRRITGETMDEAADLLAQGKLVHPDQVDGMFADLRPAAREKLKDAVRSRQAAKAEALAASPGYQSSVIGKVSAMLAGYNPEAEGFDAEYVEMASLVATLPESPARTELQRSLRTARDGGLRIIEDAKDYHRAQLDDLHKAGVFGDSTAVARRPVTDAVRAGILKDIAKLEKTGIPVETARKIAKEKDPREQISMLKEARAKAAKEGGFLDTNEPFDRAVFDALLKGEGYLESPDLAARETARRAYGHAKLKLEEWLAANPKASEEQVRKKLVELAGSNAAEVLSAISSPPDMFGIEIDGSLLPPPPDN